MKLKKEWAKQILSYSKLYNAQKPHLKPKQGLRAEPKESSPSELFQLSSHSRNINRLLSVIKPMCSDLFKCLSKTQMISKLRVTNKISRWMIFLSNPKILDMLQFQVLKVTLKKFKIINSSKMISIKKWIKKTC